LKFIPFSIQNDFFASLPLNPSLLGYIEVIAKYLFDIPSLPLQSPHHRYDIAVMDLVEDEALDWVLK